MNRQSPRKLAGLLLAALLVCTVVISFSAQSGLPLEPSVAVPAGGQAHQTAPPAQPSLPSPIATTQLDEGQRMAREQTLSLSFAEPINVRELLLLLVRDTELSVVPDPDVDGTFIGELKNVTLRQALDLILRPLGLDYSLQHDVVRVFKRRTETRIFNINYVATRRSASRSLTASTSTDPLGSPGPGGAAGASGAPGAGARTFGAAGGSGSSITVTDGGDLFQDITTGLQTLMSPEGKFNVDRKAGLLQVIDFPDRLDKIAAYLDAVQTRALRQVQIQAKVVEVELNGASSAGIDWTTILRTAGNAVTLTKPVAPTAMEGAFTIGVNIRDFGALLDALATQGKVNVLSSPRVLAMNNEPAVMRIGTQDVFFLTTSQVDAATGRILQTVVTPQSITEGVVLSMTPQISADGVINMSITPSVTERTGQATSRLGDTVPIVSVRETDTLVRVHAGETIVIAGLMQDRNTLDEAKVPVLGDVPLVGGLFRRQDRVKHKTELVILLTPTIQTPLQLTADAVRDQRRLYEQPRAGVKN